MIKHQARFGYAFATLAAGLPLLAALPAGAEFKFAFHTLATDYPNTGRYGQCGYADFDKDGRIDFFNGESYQTTGTPRQLWFKNNGTKAGWQWYTISDGTNGYNTGNAGATPHDADGDGWVDIVTSGTWYRNPGEGKVTERWARHVFDANGANAHDIFAADFDGDGKAEIVTNPDNSTSGVKHGVGIQAGLWIYKIPANVTGTWSKVRVGNSTHGGLTPRGFGDIDKDGDLDIVNMGAWYENTDGKGGAWTERKNLGFGRSGPIGISGKTWVIDFDKDGDQDIVQTEADLFAQNKAEWLENADGKGGQWTRHELPSPNEPTADWHSLGVADFDRDGDLDILVVETEWETTTQRPRWFIWENMDGKGANLVRRVIYAGNMGGHESQIVDMDGDGDIDIISREHDPKAYNAVGGKKHVDWMENQSPAVVSNFPSQATADRPFAFAQRSRRDLQVTLPSGGAHALELIDARGAVVARRQVTGSGVHALGIGALRGGVYALRVTTAGRSASALVTLNL